ncbi:MAG TPA: aspartate aminotransferase family protein [Trueperaceae bacterium]|nr:aspartate aminotransferase family protein [Trueperaceae bacterium]
MDESAKSRGRQATLYQWGAPQSEPMVVTRGSGAVVFDDQGNAYVDCTSQAWSLNVGYGHPAVLEAARQQLERLTHVRTAFDTEAKLELSAKLAELVGKGEDYRVLFTLHGSLANEGAMMLALKNRSESKNFVTLWDGYHGRSFATRAMSWPHPENSFLHFTGNTVRVPQAYCYRCPFGLSYPECGMACVDFAERAIRASSDGPPAALIMEPVQGNGGQIDFPLPYYPAMAEMAKRLGMLLIWDEIQTGFGRVGEMFASDLYGVKPDIVTFGKAAGGGFPLAGMVARADLGYFEEGDFSLTFGAFPVSIAASLATIRVIEEEGLLERCRAAGTRITAAMKQLKSSYELVGDVRGPGLMIGVELVKDADSKEPAIAAAQWIVAEGKRRGVLLGEGKYGGRTSVVKIKPPMVISDEQVEQVIDVFSSLVAEASDRFLVPRRVSA